MARKNINRSLQKGLSVLRTFTADASELTLSQISDRVDIPIGSTHRYVNTLVSLGYLKKNPSTRRYRLTPKVLELGFATLRGMNLRSRVLTYLLEAASEFNTTTACSVLDGVDIVYIERVRSVGLVNLDLSAGSRLPAYCTAMGKALLAFLDDEDQTQALANMELRPLTSHTIVDKAVLCEELGVIRERGYSFCRQELSLGLESIGAPIFSNGQVEAAISFNLYDNTNNAKVDIQEKMIQRLLSIAKEVSIA